MGVKLNILHSLALTLTTSVALVRAVESKCPDDLLHHGDLVVAKGASIEILGPIKIIENGQNGPKTSNVFESPDKETTVSLCGDPDGDVKAPVDFVARWYAGDRLKKGSFPTVTLFCAAKFGGDAPPGIEYPDVVSAGNDAIKVACYREDRSAFLKLPKYYSLEITNGTSYSLSKVGPFGLEPIEEGKPDTRDHRGFLWPSGPLNESWFNIYQYVDDPATAQVENWQDLYPVKKRVCVLRGEPLAFNMLPTVNVTASAVNITIGESDKATIQAECVDKDPKIACPATMNSVVTLTVAGNSRIRPLRNDTTNKVVDIWGKDLSVAFEAPCAKPIQVLVDMIPANQTLPGLGLQDKWNNSITVTRRTLCTYSGFSALKKAHVHFGKGSAEANHNLGPTEWWECKDREVETIQQLQARVKPSSSSVNRGGTGSGSSRGGTGDGSTDGSTDGNTNGNTQGNKGNGSSNDNGGTSNGSSGSSGSNGGGNSGDTTHQQQQGQQSQQGGSNSQGGEEARGGSGGGSGRENPFN